MLYLLDFISAEMSPRISVRCDKFIYMIGVKSVHLAVTLNPRAGGWDTWNLVIQRQVVLCELSH